jgi:hypothetical protein
VLLRRFAITLLATALALGAVAPGARAATPFTVYLPNVVKTLGGQDGWHTPFIVQNVGSTATSLTVSFYKFIDGSLVATRRADVLPGRSFVDSPRDDTDLPDNAQFSVVITSSAAPVVAIVNEHQGFDAGTEALSYSGIAQGSTQVYLPLVYKQFDDWLTTLIIQNVGTATADVTATFVSLDGKSRATLSRTVDPGRSKFIDPRIETALAGSTIYAVTMGSTEPIAVVANGHHDLPGVSPAMGDSYNAVPMTAATTSYLPYVPVHTDGKGAVSRVFVQNAGTALAAPIFTFTRFTGTSVNGDPAPFPGPMLAPGAGFLLTPPVPDGDFALTITGGSFAAVTTVFPTSGAMFYTGTSAAASKIFLPNVTRVLAFAPGDPGWNTPIYIQSATATSATLTWYRFSDGSVVTTQTVALTAGTTTRVDPKSVSGLTDNSQYAVVIESSGTLVAIVTEINPIAVAGDDAMIYKGFPPP